MSQSTVLVVEDERIVAEDIKMSLEDAGYHVCGIAKRGEEAIALAKEHQPDLALLDIVLRGDMDGIGVAHEIKQYGIPFIFLTAYSQQGVVERAKETEPMGYLIKPFEQAALVSAVEIAIHKAQMDQQLQASAEWFFTTLHSIGDGVIAADPTGNIVFMNGVAEDLTQWTSDNAVGKPLVDVFQIVHEESREVVENPLLVALESGEVTGLAEKTVLIRPDGSEIPIDDSGSPIRNSEGKLVGAVLIFRDISVQRDGERRKEEYQEHLEELVSQRTKDLRWRIHLEAVINDISLELLDLSDNELAQGIRAALGRMGTFLKIDFSGVYLQEGGSLNETFAWQKEDELLSVPIDAILESSWSGDQIDRHGWAAISDLDERGGDPINFRDALSEAGIASMAVFPLDKRDQSRGVLMMANRQPYAWTDHQVRLFEMFVHIVRSGLQRLETGREKQRLMEELNQASKLEAIGKLTGGIAHDFNNMLLPIIGYSDMLLERDDLLAADQQELQEIRKAAESAADLTHQLLAFSRKQILEKAPMDLNALVEDKRVLLNRILGEDIRLEIDLMDGEAMIEADRGQMDQVIMNLCVNARDAMSRGGTIEMSTSLEMAARPSNGESLQAIRFIVKDTGPGMDPEIIDRVFDPFFTTKGLDGTGLGLSVVVGIIEQHEGWIDLDSALGEGTQFTIYLPAKVVAASRKAVPLEEVGKRNGSRGERILLVEDEPSVINFVKTALTSKGYQVITAMTAKEALRVFDEHDGRFDMIFSDAMLPDGTGMEVLDRLLTTHPHIRGLLSSGYTDHRALVDAAREKDIAFLHKPYALTSLYEMVGKVLGQEEDVPLAS